MSIKVGFCVAYDWELLKRSVPLVYDAADIICLSIDKYRKSWSGRPYEFNEEAFESWVKDVDKERKIQIIEDDFSDQSLTSRENCNLQRTKMAEAMGKGGWHVQIDADEYFVNFSFFAEKLKSIHPNPIGNEKGLNVCAPLIPLIKKVDGGYLYVKFMNRMPEMPPFATNKPNYKRARHNGYFNVFTRFYAFHETWARGEEELNFKLSNWGHASEELADEEVRKSYLNLWRSLDRYNCHYIRDFHPVASKSWPALHFLEGNSIDEVIKNFQPPQFPLSPFRLWLKNNRTISRILHRLGINIYS